MDERPLVERVKALGGELGFSRVGVARAEPLGVEAQRMRAWLAAGYHGDMQYLHDTADVRFDPTDTRMLEGARSVIVFAAAYADESTQALGPMPGKVARYAQRRDYHKVIYDRLRPMKRLLRAAGFEARAAVDGMPVMERAWAQRAGVGFIGKNCCVIVPGIGSHVFLGVVVTTAELPPDEPIRERCGECRLCLDKCPTSAFVQPRVLDARRCIAYLTIEHRDAIDPALREPVGDWMFGCDVCQDVCPYNRTQREGNVESLRFGAPTPWNDTDASAFLTMNETEFTSFAHRSPLLRARREGMARNAAIVLGNRGGRVVLPVLRSAAMSDSSPVVREAAAWAAARIEAREPDEV
jgi:epoxyqueuosine reductase